MTLAEIDRDEPVVYEAFDASKATDRAVNSMRAAAMKKGIDIILDIEPDVHITSDEDGILQIITILLDNAVKYTDSGGKIEAELSKCKSKISFSLKNSGSGIPKQDLPKIFDRFYRADPSRSQGSGGYGLGLSIAKAIADNLGGRIFAESVEGEYVKFTLILSCRVLNN